MVVLNTFYSRSL